MKPAFPRRSSLLQELALAGLILTLCLPLSAVSCGKEEPAVVQLVVGST